MLNALTTMRTNVLQERLYDFLLGQTWYIDAAGRSDAFPAAFESTYQSFWRLLLLATGRPQENAATTVLLFALTTIAFCAIGWFCHGITAHVLARWQGGRARAGHTLGLLAVGWSPLLIASLALLPGVGVPLLLLFLWLICAQYQAVQQAHALHWPRTLAAVVAPYLFWLLLLASTALLLLATGLAQIPYLNEVVNVLRGT